MRRFADIMVNEETKILEGLNNAQKEAVINIDGPSLIIAGAGSGKTKVLTCRIANILSHGCSPSSIMALTFTNKASNEMKSRIANVVGEQKARRLWMGTFHSIFARFLRDEAELLGFPKSYTIYDTSDSKNLIKSCIKELQLDDKLYKPNEVYSRISMAKNNLVTAQAYSINNTLQQIDASSKRPRIHEIYTLYAKRCKLAGAMDFDDILLFTNILFRDFPEALERIRNRFKYILVDEFQDTNLSQYYIVKKLAACHGNIAVVGDDAQSIYSFRGARIENILNFKKDFPNAAEYRLERNYRSTKVIVNAANTLINNNKMQLKKKCYSEQEEGEKIELISAFTEQEEAFMVASSISESMFRNKVTYGDFAILYRTNAQSRVIEEALRRKNMPYKIFAAHSFYERAEIKDMLAYFRLVLNPKDNEAFTRIINFPARGIGDVTIARLKEWSQTENMSYTEVLKRGGYEQYGLKGKVIEKIVAFNNSLEKLREQVFSENAYDMALKIDSCFGISSYLKQDVSLEGQSRLQNVEELLNSIKAFVEEGYENQILEEEADQIEQYRQSEYTLQADRTGQSVRADQTDRTGQSVRTDQTDQESQASQSDRESQASQSEQTGQSDQVAQLISLDLYMQNVSLLSDTDTSDGIDDKNKISLMTVHSAKGLEFPYVYIIGAEENLFPSCPSSSSDSEIEEERRLFYVAMTRAKNSVKISFAHSRIKWGSHVNNEPSRFIKEIDSCYIENPLSKEENEYSPDRTGYESEKNIYTSGKANYTSGKTNYSDSQLSRSLFNRNLVKVSFAKPLAPRNPNFIADSPTKLKVGQHVEHERFGTGIILSLEGSANEMKAVVNFDESGKKTLLLKFAKIRIISE